MTTPEYSPPPKKGMSGGKKLGLGCLGLIVLAILLGGCLAILAAVGSDSDDGNGGEGGGTATTAQVGRGAVTLDEFNQVTEGMTREQVEGIFQAEPINTSSSDFGLGRVDTITYPGDGFGDTVVISYDETGKVTSKFQSGLG